MKYKYLLFGLIIILMSGIVTATCTLCNETCSPCGGGCNTTDFTNMFQSRTDWTAIGNISGWNTSCITNMRALFKNSNFNQSINSWDVSNVTDMGDMFWLNNFFNQPLNNWNVGKVTDMSSMFASCDTFNQNLSSWNTSSVTDMSSMFSGTTSFNGDISSWDVSNVTAMSSMFYGAYDFNQPLNNWNVGKVTSIYQMFASTNVFNQNLSSWNTSSVTNMASIFNGALVFNQDISGWDTSKVTAMQFMFGQANAFNQNVGLWNVSSVTSMSNMFTGITLSTANYDALLNGWASQIVKNNVLFSGGNSKYSSNALISRNTTLIGVYNWSITDGGKTFDPVIISSRLSPTTAYKNTLLLGFCNASDSDTSSIFYNYVWYLNGVSNTTGIYSATAQAIERNVANITASAKNQNWSLGCTANDSIVLSSQLNSSILTISNSVPTFNQSNFTSIISHNSNISLQINVSDLDSDTLTYAINSTAFTINSSTGLINKTAGDSSVGVYNVSVNVTDGTATSTMWILFNITNNVPVITQSLSNMNISHSQNLSLQFNCSDADADTLLYYDNTSLFDINSSGFIFDDSLQSDVGIYNISITCGDGLVNVSTSFVYQITNGLHQYNTISTSPSIVYMFNNFSLRTNVSDVDNDISSINYSIKFPNASIINYTSTLINGLYVSQSFIATNGSYNVTILGDDGTFSNYSFAVSDSLIIQPSTLSFAVSNGSNYNFTITITDDSSENLSFSITDVFTTSLINASYNINPVGVNGSGQINVNIMTTANITGGTYYGNITINRTIDGRITIIPLTIGLTNIFGIPQLINITTSAISMTAGASTSIFYNLTNVGTYNLSNCTASLSGSFTGFTFWSSTIKDVGIGEFVDFIVYYISPSAGTYSGYLNINCVATSTGASNSLASSNQPLHNLVVAPYVPPAGGGGGSSYIPPTSTSTNSTFTLEKDDGGSFAGLYFAPGQSRDISIILTSLSSVDQDVSLSCVGSFCTNVVLSKNTVHLYGRSSDIVLLNMKVDPNVPYNSSYAFTIVGTDNSANTRSFDVQIKVSPIASFTSKFNFFVQPGDSGFLFSIPNFFNVPKILFYVVVLLVLESVLLLIVPDKSKGGRNPRLLWMPIIGILASVLMIVLI